MDLAEHDPEAEANAGASVHLNHFKTGEPLIGDDGQPVLIHVVGAESTAFRNHIRAMSDARNRNRTRTLTAAQQELENVDTIVKVVTGWSGNWSFNGEKPAFSPAKAKEILLARPWIREQVDTFVANRQNFGPG